MIRELLRRWFIENAALKSVAMILAITLFILVHGERDAVIAAHVRVTYSAMPEDRVLMSEPISTVRVMVKGSWTRIKKFDEREVESLYIDLSKVADGDYAFQEDMIHLPPGLSVVSINPPSIRLEFDKTATKVVPVVPKVEGEPAHGYRIDRVTARPSHVTIKGPKTVIDAMTGIETKRIPVAGKTDTFTVEESLAPSEAHVTLVDEAPVEVEVTVAQEAGEVSLEIPVSLEPAPGVVAPAPGRVKVDPDTVSIVLRGTKTAVESVDRARTVARVELHAEDLRGGSSRRAVPVVVGLPQGVAYEVRPREVTLTTVGR